MSVTIEQPSILETQVTGWLFTLKTEFRGAEYAARYEAGTVTLSRDGSPLGAAIAPPSAVVKRFNRTAGMLFRAHETRAAS